MAVEAQHLYLYPPQLLANREIINAIESNANLYNSQLGFNVPIPVSQTLAPLYNFAIADSIVATTTNAADSGLTCNFPTPRKRSREFNSSSNNNIDSSPFVAVSNHKDITNIHPFSFLGEDLSLQFRQQQLEIDRFIAQHVEKVRMEVLERRRQQSNRLIVAFEERLMKRLKAKEDEIEKIGRLNWALEERVKSLCMENQIWRDLAHTNEATAIALRTNLEQVMAQVRNDPSRETAEDAESCCDSSSEAEEMLKLAGEAQDKKEGGGARIWRGCRNCGREEACVLLLPCRHLCLCTSCSSSIHTCPVCKSNKNATVHVNMS